ncbi:SWI SNF-related matrix-associated actin-dependent regulator of chromatin subfamily A member 5, partial [Paramuricea clavata]
MPLEENVSSESSSESSDEQAADKNDETYGEKPSTSKTGRKAQVAPAASKGYDEKIEKDRATRFNFLLEKTEIFSHFMNPTSGKKPKSPLKMKAPDFPSPERKTSESGDHRHRHTEQEEDAELLEQSKHQKAIVHFEQSPS